MLKTVKPVLSFKAGEVELGYNVGTRGNGGSISRDGREDLMTEIVR
jgi:hypothetical protein